MSENPNPQTPPGEDEFVEPIRESLTTYLTDASALEVARYVVQKLDREADDETLEYDFHVTHGEMHVDPQYAERNVWFKFDTKKKDAIHYVKRSMYEADCNVAELEYIDSFMQKVCRAIERNHATAVEAVLRRVMFKGKPMPIKLERCTMMEVIDFSQVRPEENYQLLVHKDVPKSVLDAGEVGASVSAELFDINIRTGKGFNEIIRQKKAEGNPNYAYVTCAETKKMLWECQLDMYVNFSLPPLPETPPESDLVK